MRLRYRAPVATAACRGCGAPPPPGRAWHPDCLSAYRRSHDYRDATLSRDGHDCASCSPLRNRLADRWWQLRRAERPVDVDHIDPIGGTGTHDPANLQVLCLPHHRSKTRRDLARLKGRPAPATWTRRGARTALALTVTWAAANPHSRPALAALLITALALAGFYASQRRARHRARAILATATGVSLTNHRAVRPRRWRLTRADTTLPHWRPTRIALHYPPTWADHDPDTQTRLEQTITAKFGGTWAFSWHTQTDTLNARSPDPLADPTPTPWPNAGGARLSLWQPIPIGVAADGRPVTVTLPERNLLVAGEPGAGKSAAVSMLTATAALDPDATLHLLDGKVVELAEWRPSAEDYAGHDVSDATDLLGKLQQVCEARYELLLDSGKRKVAPGDGLGLHYLIVDELAYYLTAPNKTQRETFTARLRDIVSRGRAAGIITVAATQRPSADIIPTSIRDLFGFRWALRCTTPSASDMVLGQGWASLGHRADRIDGAHRGVGLLLHEGGVPVRLKAHYIDDAALAALAARSARARAASRSVSAEVAADGARSS